VSPVSGKWETIRYALDENSRTARLVVIVLALAVVGAVTGAAPFVVMALCRHFFG
jgi:hypothetical protein